MPQLTIQISDSLLGKLQKQARFFNKPIDEWVVERLETISETVFEPLSKDERMEKFLRESDLFAALKDKLGSELETLAYYVSPERRKELAQKASVGKPLSEIIIEDRGG
jgi:hypothetical protein